MWRNRTMVHFVDWLRHHNSKIPEQQRRTHSVGFYGMDVYSLHSSAEAVIQYLKQHDPEAAKKAEARYHCFDRRVSLLEFQNLKF